MVLLKIGQVPILSFVTLGAGEQEELHGKLASLPGLIKDQCALGILSVLRSAAHGKKGRVKAYAKIILRHVEAGHAAGAHLTYLTNN